MNNLLSSPFSFLDTFCTGRFTCVGVSGLPDWLQAGALFGQAIPQAIVLAIFYGILYWVLRSINLTESSLRDSRKIFVAFLYCGVFWPAQVGIVAGGASLVYGLQYGLLGFAIGGGIALVVCLIVLLVLLGTMRYNFWLPQVCAVIGLSLFYYGSQYSSPGFVTVGWFIDFIYIMGMWAIIANYKAIFKSRVEILRRPFAGTARKPQDRADRDG